MPRVYFKLIPEFPKAAGTAKEFRDWDLKLQAEYPTRYKINEFVGDIVNKCWTFPKWRYRDFKLALMYRYCPVHQYHKVVIGEPAYYEPFDRILRAPFCVFAEFMDNIYNGKSHVQWHFDESEEDSNLSEEFIEEKNAQWVEMEALYNWWTKERPAREDELNKAYPLPDVPKEWGIMSIINDDFRNTPEVIALRECYDIRSKVEAEWDKEDCEMLCRLAKIRLELWD